MVVCHCKGLSDRDVRSAIRAGAQSRRQVTRTCGAGSHCGGCRPVIEEILADELASDVPVGLELAPAR